MDRAQALEPDELPLVIGAVTDEFSPTDYELALTTMTNLGMTAVELRLVHGRNIVALSDAEIDHLTAQARARGMRVLSIASPLLKCELPAAPEIDKRFHQDVFGSSYGFDDQPRLARRTFEIARRAGAGIVRCFSYWRSIDPERCFERVAGALHNLARDAASQGLVIGLENEHACNVATAAETARMLEAVNHPALKAVWDPANALVAGEQPYPEGYEKLPPSQIAHVHAKDCRVIGGVPEFGPLGEMGIDWKGQIAALVRDGYRGAISLETHWQGPAGDKLKGSIICGRTLRNLVRNARTQDVYPL